METRNAISRANNDYNLGLTDNDVYFVKDEIYISSQKAAAMFHVDYHYFCAKYAKLLAGRVRVACLGKCKYYHLEGLGGLLEASIQKGVGLLNILQKGAK